MDALWFRRQKADNPDASFVDWEFSAGTVGFKKAGAPAQAGQKLASVVGVNIPPRHAGLTTDIVHWSTGISWGLVAGTLTATKSGLPAIPAGVVAGTVAFGTSYAALGQLGIYKPIWTYDAETLWKDFSAHMVFGITTGVALGLLQAVKSR